MTPLWAVHISDGVLKWPWLVGGFVVAFVLGWVGGRRLADEEIPRIAVMSSAFFVASLIHVRIGTSVHLLLNTLVGVVLGRRAALAIPLALVLQAMLLAHGGLSALGVNTCVMVLPALGTWLAFAGLRRARCLERTRLRWAAGFVLGALGVAASATLNCLVLWLGGTENWPALVVVVLIAHVPVMVVEAFITAATIDFLAKVKPEMLGLSMPDPALPIPQPVNQERQAG